MSWIMGTASDHKDFSDKVVAAATGSSLQSVDSINAAGTGYVVGDILTLSGGTSTIAAQVEVTTVGGSGDVTAVRQYNDGVYTSAPGDPVSTTGGTGSGCTLNCTFASNGWTANLNSTLGVASVDSVAAGGTGYSVGDLITLAGGTTTAPAILEVSAVSGGVVTAATVYDPGSYTSAPGDPVAQASVQPTGGSGATFNLTFTAAAGRREVILEGSGGSTDEILVGWRTLESVGGDYYNLELHGFTGYLSANAFTEQPGISPGVWDAGVSSERAGAYLISYPVSHDYFLHITPYRIIMKTKLTGRYFDAYLGWGNRFATVGEHPYPMLIAGCTSWYEQGYGTSQQVSGICDPWRNSDADGNSEGPMFVYMPDGTWYSVWNSNISGGARGAQSTRVVVPTGEPAGAVSADSADKFMTGIYEFNDLIPDSGLSTTPQALLYPTGSTDVRSLLPTMVVFTSPSAQVPVEIDNVFWTHAYGGVTSEDRIIDDNGDVFRVFQSGNRSDVFGYMAIKEQ